MNSSLRGIFCSIITWISKLYKLYAYVSPIEDFSITGNKIAKIVRVGKSAVLHQVYKKKTWRTVLNFAIFIFNKKKVSTQ